MRRTTTFVHGVRSSSRLATSGASHAAISQPNVAMQRLELIKPDRLGAAVGVIFPIWERSNRYVLAHSQSMITLGVRPSLDELLGD